MLFKRKHPPTIWERVRIALWPRTSFKRSWRYIMLRVMRLRASPHAIALGFAVGGCIAFTPVVGFHFIFAGLIAWLIGGSVLAAALGTFTANPLTLPLIWYGSHKFGALLLQSSLPFDKKILSRGFRDVWDGMMARSTAQMSEGLDLLWPFVQPMALGGILLGAAFGALIYFPVRRLAQRYQDKRAAMLQARRQRVAILAE